ncbi:MULTISPECIES: hypothetical protein [Synechococcaceae]|uniref:hypothetical protein n=1 Tax=Synechococcaceae TaxID=1890426 RepID=UPI0008FF20AA|nr:MULTISPECIES: hypothetical protein [Synechococcaceae]APD49011.1 hypothetical protein BM449_13140 [Synechococcus sp. SynAce01]MCT4364570.1 hypothetical protein [Candidatus Regnicoccus frigidus MAG-AL1]MCT4367992.1 hypothetical protein [Candidatus Regnicoccus frigidus MAG-AL2]TWB88271.1 hypothetical protein FB106_11729 [Synechococcus sp. Ace-Pa]
MPRSLFTLLRPASATALPWLALLLGGVLLTSGAQAATCSKLNAVGGGTSVSKSIQLDGPLVFPFGRTNFNTDFAVTRPYNSYRLNFKSTSTKAGPFPIQAYLKFSDGTNLQVVNETFDAQPGEFKQFGPVLPPANKLVSQVNMKVGSGYNANATGFSYTISVYGCR